MEQLLAIPGNSRCCDCGAAEPRWASINLGCTLCIECSGIHRSFGVHMSKVRSITLDTWEPEQLKVMLELGNAVVNGIYEGAVDESIAVRAKPDSNRSVRESWIRAKYVDKAFVKKLPGVTRANKLSKWSVRKKSRRSPARLAAMQKTRSSSGSALSKTVSLPGNLPSSSPATGDSESEKNSPQSKDSGREDSVLSGSGSAEEDEGSMTSDMMEGGVAASKRSVESCPLPRAVMSVSGCSIPKSLSGGGGDGEVGGGAGGKRGGDISDSGIADTTGLVSKTASSEASTASNSERIVFGVDRPARLAGLNKTLDLESSDDSCQDFDDAEDNQAPDAGTGARSSTSGMTDRSSGVDCATEEDLTTSWEDMSRLDPHLLLYKACGARNLPVMLQALANKADPNWVNLEDGGRTPIMRAIVTGSMATCEFLLLNNAKLDRKDRHGQTPLHHATILGHTGQVCQLLKRRADLNAKDNQQRTPLMIAVDNANADIVTLLRLAKFDEEMKESEGYMSNPADDTFQDVFRDFTNMASNNPEKLKRK
ncbi:ARF-GAP with coiled-coil, ANK repeat and PH domain-containing protein 2 [Elysia marginata]|uniref:ARF-GAP with coiled-coil, ANK repeat and PH domain-containing protein 2 n=1 Tax=Elysia marginata TaxID=1093978 RepID=A0AAV4EPU8_9GAST|nr:ARF-GAP with coiled-coil, ANK repeat and PH domain-containing protein 2 [Elysia marginata]